MGQRIATGQDSSMLWHLMGAYLILQLIAIRFLPTIAQSGYSPTPTSASWSSLTQNDPTIGSPAFYSHELKEMKVLPALVLAIEDCGPCNAEKLRYLANVPLSNQYLRVALVVGRTSLADVERLALEYPNVHVKIAPDRLVSSWNVSFRPRLYVLNEQGCFQYLQDPMLSTVGAILQQGAR